MQVDGGGGQLRDFVEVTVGQYGCADVLMVISTVLTVVTVLRPVVVYVVGVDLQVAGEVVRWADVPESRASRLERQGISSEDFRLARSRKRILVMVGQSTIPRGNLGLSLSSACVGS